MKKLLLLLTLSLVGCGEITENVVLQSIQTCNVHGGIWSMQKKTELSYIKLVCKDRASYNLDDNGTLRSDGGM